MSNPLGNAHSKLFGCQIHDSIRVSPSALKIIDTPEFQRMRNIKQLGLCHYVYPTATQTRFEHSLGVYHLAGKMLEKIQQQYPEYEYDVPEFGRINLDAKITECIKIAALCHDIGHGPFSHIFDDILLRNSPSPNNKHETRSCLIVEIICRRELSEELSEKHISFIKSIIHPESEHKGALYQIVSNNLNGIDVDKFDYLMRDSRSLGLSMGFKPNRIISEFIIDKNGNIAYPKQSSIDIYELFHSRYMMHKKVYNHKTVKLVELMLEDLFIKVDNIFGISKSIENMYEFCKLTDETIFHYIQQIMSPPIFFQLKLDNQDLQRVNDANNIYQNILSRKLYQLILEIPDNDNSEKYLELLVDHMLSLHSNFNREDFQIIRVKIGFVSGNKSDPFESIYFYNKKEDNNTFTIKKDKISPIVSDKIQEITWMLVCKKRSIYPTVMLEVRKSLKIDPPKNSN